MEEILYIMLPLLAIAMWIGFNLLNNYFLSKKRDNHSRIKFEARKRHIEEDHNNRLTKCEDSKFLWKINTDEGIKKRLKNQARAKR